ncbi:hypothetical protein ACHAXH_001129 [Discostella pseudostelligera]
MMVHLAHYSILFAVVASFHAAAEAWTPSQPPSSAAAAPTASAVSTSSLPQLQPAATKISPTCSNNGSSSRTEFLRQTTNSAILAITSSLLLFQPVANNIANAAPPFAIMAEELGYFPVTDETSGATVMVPAKIKRHSTDQAIALAKYLQSTKSTMYGAFWCPHCIRQKELFGMEAFKFINYMECDPKGYKSQSATCFEKGVDGFPSWKFGNGKQQGGEMELMDIAKISGFLDKKGMNAFDANLEFGVPPLGSGASCQ